MNDTFKKLLGIILMCFVFVFLFATLTPNAYAAEIIGIGTCGEGIEWTLDRDGLLTFSGTGEMGYPDNEWDRDKIISVEIKEGITFVSAALNSCRNLKTVSFPSTVNKIEIEAFELCTSLEGVIIPNGVTTIGYRAFQSCTNLKNIVIPESVTTIDSNAFCSCSSLESIAIPDGVCKIGQYAFSDCTSLKNVQLPDSLENIEIGVFKNCTALRQIGIPAKVSSISYFAFSGCTNLRRIFIPGSIIKIDNVAFFDCYDLAEVYYSGTEAQWNEIVIGEGNDPLLDAARYYGAEGLPLQPITEQFTDVNEKDWFCDAVKYVVGNGLMNGISENKFAPNTPLSRAMLVTILYRFWGAPKVTGVTPYTDVESGRYYTNAVIWATEKGVVNGYGDGTFGVDDTVTREQLATILLRFTSNVAHQDESPRADLSTFSDENSIHNWARDGMEWAVAKSIITGRTASTLVPLGNTTRAEAATMLMRYIRSAF